MIIWECFAYLKNSALSHLTKHSQIIFKERELKRERKWKEIRKLYERSLCTIKFWGNISYKFKKARKKKKGKKEEKREFGILPYLFRSYVNSLARFTNKVKRKWVSVWPYVVVLESNFHMLYLINVNTLTSNVSESIAVLFHA